MADELETPEDSDLVAVSFTPDRPVPPRLASVPALGDVYRKHAADVGRWAARLGGPRVDVDDVVQEVFIVASHKLCRFRGEAKLSTWLFRITDRVVRNHRRWLRVRRVLTRLTPGLSDAVETRQPDPLEALERRRAVADAYRVLDALPEKYRRVLILFELEELAPVEIARLLETRLETVRVWLHRARRLFLQRQEDVARRGELEEQRS
jgi:RNA polymerase sigma-70 factor, ECF subfamily